MEIQFLPATYIEVKQKSEHASLIALLWVIASDITNEQKSCRLFELAEEKRLPKEKFGSKHASGRPRGQ